MTASERFGPRCRRLTLERTTSGAVDPRLQVQPKFCLRTGARQPSHRFFPVSTVQMNPHRVAVRILEPQRSAVCLIDRGEARALREARRAGVELAQMLNFNLDTPLK